MWHKVLQHYVVKYTAEEFDYYATLGRAAFIDRETYLRIAKLTAIIRLSAGLDISHRGKFRQIKITSKEDKMILTVETNADMTLELGLFGKCTTLFEDMTLV